MEAGDAAEAAESSAAEGVEEVADTLPEGAERGCVRSLWFSLYLVISILLIPWPLDAVAKAN